MRVCNVYLSMALTMKHLIFWCFALKIVDEGGCRDVTARKIREQEDAYTKTVIYNPSPTSLFLSRPQTTQRCMDGAVNEFVSWFMP